MKRLLSLTIVILHAVLLMAASHDVVWYDGTSPVTYSVVGKTSPVVDMALQMFRSDISMVTGHAPHQTHNAKTAKIEIYQLDEANAKAITALDKMNVLSTKLMTQMDAFYIGIRNGKIIVVGNNGRGTAYGLLELSRQAGVSPWVWWGDVVPQRRKTLSLPARYETLQSPSVQYRGIFINDEDWSTLQWANRTVEPRSGKGVIGPATYKRIFQLLLRLRANTVWPAMHEVTKAFFNVKGNREMADSCGIVLGSSHCEPLLRNGVGEWDTKKRGAYNFITNRHNVEEYWKERLQEMNGQEGLFTIGMRGIHDGSMEGVKTPDEKLRGLQDVINSQRQLISTYYNNKVEEVPQVFIPYKEVLDIYERGLQVPDDVTLMWCDDNYGYMTRMSDAVQQRRKGGAGVYYHLSYWGRPHDYLWLSTTQPGLVCSELRQAYDHNARRIWIVNVHDPKVAAYNLSLAMDMAWNINSVTPATVRKHLHDWLQQQYGAKVADAIAPAMERFYWLCGIRKPEFMGWTQVELDKRKYNRGLSRPEDTEFSEMEFGSELERYLEDYDEICSIVNAQQMTLPAEKSASYFAHVLYPVNCAAAMAHKHLDAQMGDSLSAINCQGYIHEMTRRYNSLCNGKWNGLMDCQPRRLPVFEDFIVADTTSIRHGHSRPLAGAVLDGCVARNACRYDALQGKAHTIELLGHSMKALSLSKGSSVTYTFEARRTGKAVIRTALIPTQASDKGDIRYSVSIDGMSPVVYSLKEPYRSEEWKRNVLRAQARRVMDVDMTEGKHTLTITALDDHIVLDQWMLDYKKDRQFYVFPLRPEL